MKRVTILLTLCFIATSSFGQHALPKTAQELSDLYKKYHDTKDLKGLLTLRYYANTPDSIKDIDRSMDTDALAKRIISISIEELSADLLEMIKEGVPDENGTLYPTLNAQKSLRVTFAEPDTSQVKDASSTIETPIGEINGHWYIVSVGPSEK